MTEHIYAHEHPETERRREGGFTLWFTGLSGSDKLECGIHGNTRLVKESND